MKLANAQLLPVDLETAWQALNDNAVLQACIPGCESLKATAPDRLDLVVMAAVGPVKARFKGVLTLSDLHPPRACRIDFEGQGGPAGHGRGSARVVLEPTGPASTTLHYAVDANVGGKIAQIGQRLVDMAAQRMAADFFTRFEAKLRELHPVAAPAPAVASAPPTLAVRILAVLRTWFRRLSSRMT